MDHQSYSDMDLSFGSSGSLKSAGGDKPQNPPIFDLNFPSVQYDFPDHGNLDVTQPEDAISKPSPQTEITSEPLPVDLLLPEPLLPLRSDEEKELENNSGNFVVDNKLVLAVRSKWELPQSVNSASSVLVKPCLSPPDVMLEPLSVELVVERNGEEKVVENNSGNVVKDDQLVLAEKSKGKLPQFVVSAPSVVVKPCVSLLNIMLEPLPEEFVLPNPLPSLMSGEEKVVEKNSDNAVADDCLVLAEKSKGKLPQFVNSAPSVVVKSSISLPDMLAHLRQLAMNPCFVMISKIRSSNCHSMNLVLNTRRALYPKVETKISKSLGFPYQEVHPEPMSWEHLCQIGLTTHEVKRTSIGPSYQADLPPIWTGSKNKRAELVYGKNSDSLKFLGTQLWPMPSTNNVKNKDLIGKGRDEKCLCPQAGSSTCITHHKKMKNLELKSELQGTYSDMGLPIWTGSSSKRAEIVYGKASDSSKFLGTQLWPMPVANNQNSMGLIGKGRDESCLCPQPGSSECIMYHKKMKNLELKSDLQGAYSNMGLDTVGDQVLESWTLNEQLEFEKIVKENPISKKKYFFSVALKRFPQKTMKELVSYYYNVHVCRRMVLQSQLKPVEIDSEDDELDGKNIESLIKTMDQKKRASKGKKRPRTTKKKTAK